MYGMKNVLLCLSMMRSIACIHLNKTTDLRTPSTFESQETIGMEEGELGVSGTSSAFLDTVAVDRMIYRRISYIQHCYEQALRKNPKLEGKMVMQFSILQDVSISNVFIQLSTVHSQYLEQCIVHNFQQMTFSMATGSVFVLSFPFLFTVTNETTIDRTRLLSSKRLKRTERR